MAQALLNESAKDPLVAHGGGDDRSPDRRVTLLIRAAKLVTPQGEHLCVIRDASPSGVRLKLFQPVNTTGALVLELANGERFAVEPVWQADGYASFRFPGEVDMARLVESERGEFPSRRLRLRVSLPVRVIVGGHSLEARIENISQQGAGLHCENHLALDQLVRLEVEGRCPVFAKVRWRRKPDYGLVFEQTFGFEDLARYLAG